MSDIAEVPYDKLDFFRGRTGLPDCHYHLGVVPLYIEVKREGRKPEPKQEYEMEKLRSQGYFATMCVAGDSGLDSFYSTLLGHLSKDNVDRHVEYLRDDVEQLRLALEDITGGRQ